MSSLSGPLSVVCMGARWKDSAIARLASAVVEAHEPAHWLGERAALFRR
jgi:hypothetical protein